MIILKIIDNIGPCPIIFFIPNNHQPGAKIAATAHMLQPPVNRKPFRDSRSWSISTRWIKSPHFSHWKTTLWWTYKKLLNMAIEIVDFPMKNGGSFHCFVTVHMKKYVKNLWGASESVALKLTGLRKDGTWSPKKGIWWDLIVDLYLVNLQQSIKSISVCVKSSNEDLYLNYT